MQGYFAGVSQHDPLSGESGEKQNEPDRQPVGGDHYLNLAVFRRRYPSHLWHFPRPNSHCLGYSGDYHRHVDDQRQAGILINNGSEVASLDQHKVEGVPQSNVILSLLGGLVSTDAEGHLVPAVAVS